MLARRLLIVMLVLLGISVLAAVLVPPQSAQEGSTTATETEAETVPATVPSGELLRRRIYVGGPTLPVIPLRVGDQLILLVDSRIPDDVAIPGLGLVEATDRFAPARFDILALDPGDYPIRLVRADRTVARLEIRARRGGAGGERRGQGSRSGARGE